MKKIKVFELEGSNIDIKDSKEEVMARFKDYLLKINEQVMQVEQKNVEVSQDDGKGSI